jgi:UDPglucose 6-dehydrogenase
MINVIGLGFVGLTTAVGLAYKSNKVIGIEINNKKRENFKKNSIPFHEPGLKKKLFEVIKKKNLKISRKIEIDKKKNFFFICVGTPSNRNGSINLKILNNAVKKIVLDLKKQKTESINYIIIKSTVIPGTVDALKKKYQSFKKLNFISNPEFLREGHAWEDFINPDKIVFGCKNKKDFNEIKKLYSGFKSNFFFLSEKGSEFSKYLSNTALATMISYSNEMAMFAEKLKINEVSSIFKSFHSDKRWFGNPSNMSKYFLPGLGFGGYCLPKDLSAFVNFSSVKKQKLDLLKAVKNINNKILNHQIDKVLKNINKKNKIYILGLSFKPNSDDLRDSKSMRFTKKIINLGYKNLVLCDPTAYLQLKKIFKNIQIEKKPKVNNKAYYILLTAWPEYLDFINKNKNLNILNLRY